MSEPTNGQEANSRALGVEKILGILTLVFAPLALGQQSTRLGDEFQVNSYTTSVQGLPAVAVEATGKFVVVWQSYGSSGSDSARYSIQGQRFGSDGIPLEDEFQVNSYTTERQKSPAVGTDPAGNFVVVWESRFADDFEVRGQRFGSDGSELGDEFQINTYTSENQTQPSVAVGANGGFLVVWQTAASGGTDQIGSSIQARRFDPDGLAIGDEFQVNTYTGSDQRAPRIATGDDSNFVVVWSSYGSSGSDNNEASIQGQRLGSDGSPVSNEFQVNAYVTGRQTQPEVAVSPSGAFVVVWTSEGSEGNDISGDSVQARLYAPDGSAIGEQLQVNSYTSSRQDRPAVAIDAVGNFVVVWASNGSDSIDAYSLSIQRQNFDASGMAAGGEFQVNTYTTGYQNRPSVQVDAQGRFVVAWQSVGSSGSDPAPYSIQAQRFKPTVPLDPGLTINVDISGVNPEIAVNTLAEEFWVVWQSDATANSEIFARRFANDGSPRGFRFPVNSYTTGAQTEPALAFDVESNEFMVVWQSEDQDGDSSGIYGRRFSPVGLPEGVEWAVNTYTTDAQSRPSVAYDDVTNTVMVAWESNLRDGDGGGVYGQNFRGGKRLGADFQIHTTTFSEQRRPRVSRAEDPENPGHFSFVTVWESDGQVDDDGSGIVGIYLDSEGSTRGEEFQVNAYTTGAQEQPDVAYDASLQSALITWQSEGQDGDGRGIYGASFRGGKRLGADFQVNHQTLLDQVAPRTSSNSEGTFVVVWETNDQQGEAVRDISAQLVSEGTGLLGNEFPLVPEGLSDQSTAPVAVFTAPEDLTIVWQSVSASSPPLRRGPVVGPEVIGQLFSLAANLTIDLRDFPDPVDSGGDLLTYTVTVGNDGPGIADEVVVTPEIFPDEVMLESISGCPSLDECTLGRLGVGDSRQILIVVQIDASFAGLLTNVMTVSSSAEDPDRDSNSATEFTTVPLFVDSFETEDCSAWSSVQPAGAC